jgi:hypothetical protein
MITIYTNITSHSLLDRFQKLMLPVAYRFMPLDQHPEKTAAIFLMKDEGSLSPNSFPPGSTVILITQQDSLSFNQKTVKTYPLKIPFRIQELKISLKKAARICLTHGSIQLAYEKRILLCTTSNKKAILTEKEAHILLILFQHPDPKGLLKADLLYKVWGYKSDMETHTLETHLYRLRKKMRDELEIALIETGQNRVFLERKT